MKLIEDILESDSCILHLVLSPVYLAAWIAWSLLSWIGLMFVLIFSICTGGIFKASTDSSSKASTDKDPYDIHPEPWGEDGPYGE